MILRAQLGLLALRGGPDMLKSVAGTGCERHSWGSLMKSPLSFCLLPLVRPEILPRLGEENDKREHVR